MLQPDTIEAINHVIERSHFTVAGRHAWTEEDHAIVEATFKLVERDVLAPPQPFGYISARKRASMRAHRYGRRSLA